MRHEIFLYWCDGKKGHAESAFRDACQTSSGVYHLYIVHFVVYKALVRGYSSSCPDLLHIHIPPRVLK